MKKNVLKILLAFVVIAMMFALVACGNDKPKTTPGTTPANNEPPAEGTTDPTALANTLNSVINNVTPIIDTLKGIDPDKKAAIDLGLGGYFTNSEGGGGFSVKAALNADKENPEFKFGVAVNTKDNKSTGYKDYFSLGYSAGNIYLLEGLNLVNSTTSDPRMIKMDAEMYKKGIQNVTEQAMAYLKNGMSGFTLDLSKVTGLINSLKNSLARIIELKESDDVTELIIASSKINDIVNLLKEMVFKDNWGSIEGGINTALEYIGKVVPALEDATLSTVLNDFAPSINIKVEFTGTGTAKKVNNIKLAIAFGENLKNLEVGLSVDLKKFGIGESTTIDFDGYTAQNLTSKVSVNLGGINQKAELALNVNTATGLKNEAANLATAILSYNGDTTNVAKASFDGAAFKLDIGDFLSKSFKFNNVEKTQYKQDIIMPKLVIDATTNAYTWDEEQAAPINLKTVLKQMLEGWKYVQPADDDEDEEVDELPEGVSKFASNGLWATIYNLLLFEKGAYVDASNNLCDVKDGQIVYVLDKQGNKIVTKKKATATSDDVLSLLGDYIVEANKYVGPFINFEVVGNDGKALPLTTIWENIKTQFNAAKANFQGDDSAAKVNGTEASVALYGANNGKSLIKFISYFLKVPALKDGKPDIDTSTDPWTIGATTDQITPDLVKGYIEWVFTLDDNWYKKDEQGNKTNDLVYSEWPVEVARIFFDLDEGGNPILETGFTTNIVERVLGKSYTAVVDGGLSLYAKYDKNDGLSGEVGIKSADAAGTIYLGLGGSIGFKANADVTAVTVEADAQDCVADDVFNVDLYNHIIHVLDAIFPRPVK